MSETRKLVAILVADVVGYSRLAGADEERTLARLRRLRSDLIDPAIAANHGRIVKRTGDGSIVEFRSAVDAVRCAIEIQHAMIERNAGVPPDQRIEFRVGVHVGDVVEEADADLMGDGVNVAARLEGIAEPGGISLSEDAWRHVRDRLKETFVDLGERQLKNIARPVRVYAYRTAFDGAAPGPSVAPLEKREPPRLSLVVLPFANIGGDPEQDYFVDGVTESLTTDLSRISGAFVIGRSTAFSYKGKSPDLKQIGRELNVRYVLEGSVQRSGARMRVNVQLVDAETGTHLWAERFDKPVADLFDMQDEIVSRLANRLGQELLAAEGRRAERAANPDSMDHYFLGLGQYNKSGAEFLDKARSHFDCALELDPDNVDALVRRALVDLAFVGLYFCDDRTERLRSAEADLSKALKRQPDGAAAHAGLGLLYLHEGRADRSIAECERALAIDPNFAAAHAWIGFAKYLAGRNDETEAHVLEALRISPRDFYAANWMIIVAGAKLGAGRDEEAVVWYNRSIGLNPNRPIAHFALAAALARLGQKEDAHEAVRAGLKLDPGFTIERFRSMTFSDHPVYLAGHERMCESMRMAGVREE
jgi:TolB-like protein/class 3 adenylate cyclase/Flp pilus assembly protein TadD